MANIAFYGSHNGGYAVEQDGKILLVLEVERFVNVKNCGMAQYLAPKTEDILYFAEYIPKFIMNKLNITEFETCYHINCDVNIFDKHELQLYVPAKKYIQAKHHQAHAAGCFYQSPFEDALIFSFDGGGNDGMFNIYLGNRKKGPQLLASLINPSYKHPHLGYDLGFPYMILAHYLEDIKQDTLGGGNLVYAGKLMGLCSYGVRNINWLHFFKGFYKSGVNGLNYREAMAYLGKNIGVEFDENKRISGQLAYDLAATSQWAFEETFLESAMPYIKKYPDLPICITGGCGLNIILNTRLVNEFNKTVFVGPNPNDSGIAAGMLLNIIKPKEPIDLTYTGLPMLGMDTLTHYVQAGWTFTSKKATISEIAKDLSNGDIVGVARGRAEHGPRALGNRSILCNPSIPDMKDVLNEKVKHREWYRPFAPVVRLEDVDKYFEWNQESRWMSFCPLVREEWREKLIAITHVDNTARVQTVTREQNEWLYDLLTEYEAITGVGVLLNTSFNVNGKPILSTVSDAFEIFEGSQMDCLVIEDNYFIKKDRAK
jgi:carbamoyltransferase